MKTPQLTSPTNRSRVLFAGTLGLYIFVSLAVGTNECTQAQQVATQTAAGQFRGPGGSGMYPAADIPLEWSAEKNIAWKFDLEGSGWSQPVVWEDKLFFVTAQAEKDLKPKDFAGGVKTPQSMGLGFLSGPPKTDISWQVVCLNADTGSVIWNTTIDSGRPKFAVHPSNTYATETPVVDANGIYTYVGATGKVVGLNHSGEQLWVNDVGAFKTSNSFGTGSSPAIYNGIMFVQNFSEGSADIYAFDCKTGSTRWQAKREKPETSWASPVVWQNDQRSELIISGGNEVDSFAVESGEKLWSVKNVKAATACSVCFDTTRIYFGGSDPFSSGPLFAIRAGASGDLTPKKANETFEFCDWAIKRAAPGMASPVSTGKLLYVAEKNILRCYNTESGERLYQERLPDIKMINSSPIAVGEHLILIGESGEACTVKLGQDFEVTGQGKLDDTFWSTPTVANDSLYLRGVNALYCIRKP